MRKPAFITVLALASGLCVLTSAAMAQNVLLNAPGLLEKKSKAGAPDVKAAPQAWPRLEIGAALCRSEADLSRLAANRAHTEGGGAADCQIMRAATGVQIVQRKGPGLTQVRVTDQPAVVGWTDVWLPEKAPSGK